MELVIANEKPLTTHKRLRCLYCKQGWGFAANRTITSVPGVVNLRPISAHSRVKWTSETALSLSAALSGVMSRCGIPSISKPTMNLRTVAERSSGG